MAFRSHLDSQPKQLAFETIRKMNPFQSHVSHSTYLSRGNLHGPNVVASSSQPDAYRTATVLSISHRVALISVAHCSRNQIQAATDGQQHGCHALTGPMLCKSGGKLPPGGVEVIKIVRFYIDLGHV